MWQAFRAEWRKMVGNRWLTGCLLGVFPFLALAAVLIIMVLLASNSDLRQDFIDNPTPWTEASLMFWIIPNSFFGRLIIIGLAAFMFGGEYQWETWKNLLPRRSRISLILTKFVTMGALMVSAFMLTSIIWVLGRGIIQLLIGSSYPPSLTNIPSDYWGRLLLQVGTAFISALIVSALAAMIALMTRSILATALLTLTAIIVEGSIGTGLLVAYVATDLRFFPDLYRFSMTYNVDNLMGIADNGQPNPVLGLETLKDNPTFQDFVIDPPLAGNSLGVSLVILGVWAFILIALSTYWFYRQDIRT